MSQDVDPKEAALFALKVWKYKEGAMVSLMMHIGDQLGLYAQMRGQGPITPGDLAKKTGLHERWILEWLRGQAAAELVVRYPDDTYELTGEGAEVLANEETSLLFAAGAMGPLPSPDLVGRLLKSFETGIGLTWDDQGPAQAATVNRSLGVWTRLALVDRVIPALAGIESRLNDGIDVLEIGCGAGAPMLALAQAFPKSRFIGIDPSALAIQLGNEKLDELGLTNVALETAYGEQYTSDTSFDFVLAFDCLHDMPFPERAMSNIRSLIAPEGTWLIKEIRSSESFEENQRNPVFALQYGYSVTTCLPSGMSEPDGRGLGTLGLPATLLISMTQDAGFSSCEIHDFDDPANLYYEVRP